MKILKFFGRLLVILALVSAAYMHYMHPLKSVLEVQTNYKLVDQFANKFLQYNIPFDNVNFALSRLIGPKSS